jgi:Starch-binding associating with outer membrane
MNQIKRLFTLSAITLVAFSSCKKFVDVNNDPNNNLSTKSDFVMSGALGTTYRNQVGTNLNIVPGIWTGIYAHSTSFTGGGNEKTYEYTPADFNAFTPLFDNAADYQYVMKNADKDGVSFWKDPADVMQCYVFQQLVDLYGDVPYTQAFQGVANITPKYDKQQDIYEDLIVRIDKAIANMTAATWPTSADFTVQDIYFGLNKTSWIRFANTLKLRILMRQSFMAGRDAYIQSKMATTLATGFLTSNVLVQPGYVSIAGKLNPFYANFGYNEINAVTSNYQYRKMNAVLVNWLKNSGGGADTFRLQSLAYPIGSTFATSTSALTSITGGTATVANYTGVPLGAGSGFATASASPIGPFQIQVPLGTRAGMMVLLAESFFLQAEYAQRYGVTIGGLTAKQLYDAGILAHFRTCAAPSTAGNAANAGDAFANRYLNRAAISFTPAVDKIKNILLQKWISLTHVNGLEQWSEYRKASGTTSVGVPANVKTTATTSNPEPARYLYPQGEFDNNGLNVPTGISRFTSKIFWDVN